MDIFTIISVIISIFTFVIATKLNKQISGYQNNYNSFIILTKIFEEISSLIIEIRENNNQGLFDENDNLIQKIKAILEEYEKITTEKCDLIQVIDRKKNYKSERRKATFYFNFLRKLQYFNKKLRIYLEKKQLEVFKDGK